MLQYEKIDVSEGIEVYKTHKSVECMICHYRYFKAIGFKYQPYVCNGCHDFSMIVQKLDDFVILRVKGVDYRCCAVNMSKKYTISLLNNSVLDNETPAEIIKEGAFEGTYFRAIYSGVHGK